MNTTLVVGIIAYALFWIVTRSIYAYISLGSSGSYEWSRKDDETLFIPAIPEIMFAIGVTVAIPIVTIVLICMALMFIPTSIARGIHYLVTPKAPAKKDEKQWDL